LLPKITALEQANIDEKEKKTPSLKPQTKIQAEKAIKIRIFPDKEQKSILNQWFGIRRFIYNKCVAIMKEDYKNQIKTTQKRLRALVVNNANYIENNTWMIDYEYDLRDEAMRDALKNLKSNLAKGGYFELKFLSKKYDIGSLAVLSKKWNKKNNFYSKVFRPDKIKSTEILPEALSYTSRLIKTRTKKYYFCLPQPLDTCENQAPKNSMIFIDPGVKTFITGYDPSGKIITWGENDVGRIARLLHYTRKLQSKIKKCNISKKKKKYELAFLKLKETIRHLVSELHKKLSKWLCSNYENIYIPKLNFHECKNLNKKSKAKLAALSHCMFFDRLKDKTRQYSNTSLYEVNEAFTSKTCSSCGFQKEDLKNNNTYDCDSCHIKIGRDINASKNIMLRYFTKRALLKKQGVAS
jgi:transposase